MNIEFLKFKKNFKKKEYTINLNIYWKIILYFVFTIIIAASVYGFYIFREVNKEPVILEINTNDQVEKNRKTRLENVLEYFFEREKASDNIIDRASPVVDPSL